MTFNLSKTAGLVAALPLLAFAMPAHATRAGEQKLPAYMPPSPQSHAASQQGPKQGWQDNYGHQVAGKHANDHAAFKRHDSPCA